MAALRVAFLVALLALATTGASAQSWTCSAPASASCAAGSACISYSATTPASATPASTAISQTICVAWSALNQLAGGTSYSTCANFQSAISNTTAYPNGPVFGFPAGTMSALGSCNDGSATTLCKSSQTCSAAAVQLYANQLTGFANSYPATYSTAAGRTVPACIASSGTTASSVTYGISTCYADTSSSIPTGLCSSGGKTAYQTAMATTSTTCSFSGATALAASAVPLAVGVVSALAFLWA